MSVAQAEQFDRPYVLLCEGRGDQRFFERLFEVRNLGSDFHIRIPFRAGAYNGGRSNFGTDLNAISLSESFIERVKAVLIVSDNDEDMVASFAEVQSEIRKVKGFGVPNSERIVARGKGQPAVVVLMLPPGRPGNLEVLCLESAYDKWPIKNHLDTFIGNTPASNFPLGKQAKTRMQTILAVTNAKQPDTGFAGHWSQDVKYQVPLDHACFNDLVAFLRAFPALVA